MSDNPKNFLYLCREYACVVANFTRSGAKKRAAMAQKMCDNRQNYQ